MRNHVTSIVVVICMFAAIFFSSGCSKKQEDSPVKSQTEAPLYTLLRDPVAPHLVEGNDGLLSGLQKAPGGRLIICSPSPLLQKLPEEVISQLKAAHRENKILDEATGRSPDPLILPEMTVSAALELGLVSSVIWVLPKQSDAAQIDPAELEAYFQSISHQVGAIEEVVHGEHYRSSLNRIPFEIVLGRIPPVEGPAWLHLDLAQVLAEYRGEIKGPLLTQVGGMLAGWRAQGLPVSGVSISYSTHTGDVPLSMRVVGDMVAELVASPSLLDEPIEPSYENWGRILYLEAFFSYEEMGAVLTQMLEDTTDHAWIWFANYSFAKKMGGFLAAEPFLAEAVRRDSGYAMEYVNVAVAPEEEFNPEKRVELIREGVEATKGDPLFVVTLCEELRNAKQWNELESCIGRARQYAWSPLYYPDVLPTLERWEDEVHLWQQGKTQ